MNTNEIIKECLDNLIPSNVLDLGIGMGRCSRNFLKNNSIVTGVDLVNRNLPDGINFIESSIKDFNFDKKYDLIIASLVLHFLKEEDSFKIIEDIKLSTELGGYNFILTMNKKDDCYQNKKNNFYVDSFDLKNIYDNWEILKIGDFETPIGEHGKLGPHKHNLSYILARKIISQ